jgi:hypothetical protein
MREVAPPLCRHLHRCTATPFSSPARSSSSSKHASCAPLPTLSLARDSRAMRPLPPSLVSVPGRVLPASVGHPNLADLRLDPDDPAALCFPTHAYDSTAPTSGLASCHSAAVLQCRFPALYRAARPSAPAGASSAKKKAPIFLALAFSDLIQIF